MWSKNWYKMRRGHKAWLTPSTRERILNLTWLRRKYQKSLTLLKVILTSQTFIQYSVVFHSWDIQILTYIILYKVEFGWSLYEYLTLYKKSEQNSIHLSRSRRAALLLNFYWNSGFNGVFQGFSDFLFVGELSKFSSNFRRFSYSDLSLIVYGWPLRTPFALSHWIIFSDGKIFSYSSSSCSS